MSFVDELAVRHLDERDARIREHVQAVLDAHLSEFHSDATLEALTQRVRESMDAEPPVEIVTLEDETSDDVEDVAEATEDATEDVIKDVAEDVAEAAEDVTEAAEDVVEAAADVTAETVETAAEIPGDIVSEIGEPVGPESEVETAPDRTHPLFGKVEL